ncbi:MAG: hypothetical protein M1445_11640 [Bacteroidetes bacterium]|nr:hypothetical protein [Bacteroidota bacterium]MCL6101604.1 hypothetical protein [Bacteroidota bacterium]
MRTLISVIGTPTSINSVAQKIAAKTAATIFEIGTYRFSQNVEPGSATEETAWSEMNHEISEISELNTVIVKSEQFSENLKKLHGSQNFDTRVIVMAGSAKEIQAVKNLNAGEFFSFVVGKDTPSAVAENVQKYLLQEKGVLSK